MQMFARNPRSWKGNQPTEEQMCLFREERVKAGLLVCVIHAIYLINLASADNNIFERSCRVLASEITTAAECGIEYVVTHLGSAKGLGHEKGIERVGEALKIISESVGARAKNVTLLLENGAGGGELLGNHLRDIRQVIENSKTSFGMGICIDSAHAWASGYDVRTQQGMNTMLAELGGEGEKVRLLHLNDSVHPLASHHDKHEHLGLGQIGYDGLNVFLNHELLRHLPVIMETPKEGVRGDIGNREEFLKLMQQQY